MNRNMRAARAGAVLLTFLVILSSRAESWGEIVAASVFNFVIVGPLWAAVAYLSFSQRSKTAIVVSVAVWLASASLLSYWHVVVFNARLEGRQAQCMNNLKQIGLALKQYERRYGCLPPAYVADAEGKPMHSWRVLLLPFLEYDELYRQYSFDEPWDGPNNSKLHEVGIRMFRCPYDSFDYCKTSYFAVVGDGTVWPGAGCMRTSDIRDGPAKTILLVEVAESGIHWMEPRDLSFAEMDFRVNGRPGNSISSGYGKSVSALMADGNVRRLDKNLSPDTLRALLTTAGSEKVSSDELD